MDSNALTFIAAQFGSRFVNSFLTTAVRYELLEVGGVKRFASAQVATQLARVFMQQLSGVLTDNFPLKRMYVGGEVINVVLVIVLLLSTIWQQTVVALYSVSICLGLAQAFLQPVSKSIPPAVVDPADLAIVNSWDLTSDKIGRNLAPMVFTIVASALGFRSAVLVSLLFSLALVALKQSLRVADVPMKSKTFGEGPDTILRRLMGVFVQLKEGIKSLSADRTITLLILNTIVTNMLVYPLGTVVFPVIFKAIPDGAIEQENSLASRFVLGLQNLVGIHKEKAWMNYASFVALGGVIGPVLSNFAVYQVETMAKATSKNSMWIGLNYGMIGQIVTLFLLAQVLFFVETFSAGARIILLFFVWGAMTALNNVTTIYFNAYTQQILGRSERGKFIANILTLFTLANSAGSLLYGFALAAGGVNVQVSRSTQILAAALGARMLLLSALRMWPPAVANTSAATLADGKKKD